MVCWSSPAHGWSSLPCSTDGSGVPDGFLSVGCGSVSCEARQDRDADVGVFAGAGSPLVDLDQAGWDQVPGGNSLFANWASDPAVSFFMPTEGCGQANPPAAATWLQEKEMSTSLACGLVWDVKASPSSA